MSKVIFDVLAVCGNVGWLIYSILSNNIVGIVCASVFITLWSIMLIIHLIKSL